ncbi:hypothetical protein Rfer_2726 [Rhodoferax ferrireducens T118]|uniref:DUF3309 family protein n=1 Tax=Albidiferax ferrireducens (strain ATCC BAA-621 / DSM 15236 / T118) TaxID=338969 RepID=Q21UW4_ALBFT|nr:hypothetical protein Rfer_2726 [Rhodoferax ferrireducens T118]
MIAFTTHQGESHGPRNHTSHHSDPDAGWGYANLAAQQEWGYGPSGALGLVVVIIIVLLLMGRL